MPLPQPSPNPTLLARWVPALAWLHAYRSEWFRFDLISGLTTATVVIPKAMAYAVIAGLPLVVGLYTSLIPLVVYAVMPHEY
jgi:SulP family sulfate permease